MYLVTKSQVKDIVGNINVSEDFYPALNEEVKSMIKKALQRCYDNGRRTLMARDL